MKVTAEGDVHVSDETTQSLGTNRFPTTLFGALTAIAKSSHSKSLPKPHQAPADETMAAAAIESQSGTSPWNPGDSSIERPEVPETVVLVEEPADSRMMGMLTDLFPSAGYFVAGGAAGVVSRTATAPLDRLKVYLIAQTGICHEAVETAKSGAPAKAAETAARPLIEATRALWRMGGIRSLFAGRFLARMAEPYS